MCRTAGCFVAAGCFFHGDVYPPAPGLAGFEAQRFILTVIRNQQQRSIRQALHSLDIRRAVQREGVNTILRDGIDRTIDEQHITISAMAYFRYAGVGRGVNGFKTYACRL